MNIDVMKIVSILMNQWGVAEKLSQAIVLSVSASAVVFTIVGITVPNKPVYEQYITE